MSTVYSPEHVDVEAIGLIESCLENVRSHIARGAASPSQSNDDSRGRRGGTYIPKRER